MTNTARLINLSASIEAATGLALLISPNFVTNLLLGTIAAGITTIICRIAGVALIPLAVACFQRGNPAQSSRSGAVIGLFTYNVLAGSILAQVWLSGDEIGWLLWPAAVAHLILAALFIFVWATPE